MGLFSERIVRLRSEGEREEADLSPKTINKEATGGVAEKSAGRRAEPGEALHIRRQRPHLYTIPSNARVDRHIGDGHSGRYPYQTTQRHRHRQVPANRDNRRRDRPNYAGGHKIGPSTVPHDGENIGQETPNGFQDPRNVVEADVDLAHRRLDLLNVFPVEIGDYLEEGVGEALAEAVDEGDAEDEGGVELFAEHLEPLDRLEEEGGERRWWLFSGLIWWRVWNEF